MASTKKVGSIARKKKLLRTQTRRKRKLAIGQAELFPKAKEIGIGEDSSTTFEKTYTHKLPKYSCPYCMLTGTIDKFQTKIKSGFSEKMFRCSRCKQGMRRKTLMNDMSPTEYAQWLYAQVALYDGYHRVSWKELLAGLKKHGIANEFWTAWKEAKAKRKRERDAPAGYEEPEPQEITNSYEQYERDIKNEQRST